MRSILKLCLATIAISNASSIFGSEESCSGDATEYNILRERGRKSMGIERNSPAYYANLMAIAENTQADFAVRYHAIERIGICCNDIARVAQIGLEMGVGDKLTAHQKNHIALLVYSLGDSQKAAEILLHVFSDATASDECRDNAIPMRKKNLSLLAKKLTFFKKQLHIELKSTLKGTTP